MLVLLPDEVTEAEAVDAVSHRRTPMKAEDAPFATSETEAPLPTPNASVTAAGGVGGTPPTTQPLSHAVVVSPARQGPREGWRQPPSPQYTEGDANRRGSTRVGSAHGDVSSVPRPCSSARAVPPTSRTEAASAEAEMLSKSLNLLWVSAMGLPKVLGCLLPLLFAGTAIGSDDSADGGGGGRGDSMSSSGASSAFAPYSSSSGAGGVGGRAPSVQELKAQAMEPALFRCMAVACVVVAGLQFVFRWLGAFSFNGVTV